MAENKAISLDNVLSTAIKIPGVKVNRRDFLHDLFQNEDSEILEKILEVGPVKAGCDQALLLKLAKDIVKKRTLISSVASVAAGIPGGVAMVATISGDLIQFNGMILRMAQEISYLYGATDLWLNGEVDKEKVKGQLILYYGAMFGVSGAVQVVHIMAAKLAEKALKELPKMALTKKLLFKIVRAIAKALGQKLLKQSFANGVNKIIPVVGGVVSGGMTLTSMYPMGMRLVKAFDKACFNYTEKDYHEDYEKVVEIFGTEDVEQETGLIIKDTVEEAVGAEEIATLNKIEKAKEMLDEGIITEEEFAQIKARLISEL